ncbi:MAG: DUF4350 domain-containing protein [Bacteroidia bacterium]|nr:DUF4350 domain-containing protein [Bacteroidia bacterium]
MFKDNKKIIYAFSGLLLLVIAAQYFIPQPPDWSRNYQRQNKSAFGCYAIYNLLSEKIAYKTNTNNNSLYQLNESTPVGSLLMINDQVNLSKSDVSALYNYLNKGNSVFIAANQFGGDLADSLHLKTDYEFMNYFFSHDSLISKKGVEITFTATNLKQKKYSYPLLLNTSGFSNFDSTKFNVLAFYNNNKACFIHAKIGNGHIYLSSIPDAFGNYFVVNHNNRFVAYTMLSKLSSKKIIWDEHYKTYNTANYSLLKFILESDSLYAAYLLMIAGILLYMLFESKRRQKAIKVIVPPENSTLQFVSVISHVYYNSKNHKHVAVEKIKYFYETVRKKFNVNTSSINAEFMDEMATLSGIDKTKVKQLFNYCEQIKTAGQITEYDLVELNRQIHNFNKNSLR